MQQQTASIVGFLVLTGLALSGCAVQWERGPSCAPSANEDWLGYEPGDQWTATGWEEVEGIRLDATRTTTYVGVESVHLRGQVIETFREDMTSTASGPNISLHTDSTYWYDACGPVSERHVGTYNLPGWPDRLVREVDSSRCTLDGDEDGTLAVGQAWTNRCDDRMRFQPAGGSSTERHRWTEESRVVSAHEVDVAGIAAMAFTIEDVRTSEAGTIENMSRIVIDEVCFSQSSYVSTTFEYHLVELRCQSAGIDTYASPLVGRPLVVPAVPPPSSPTSP